MENIKILLMEDNSGGEKLTFFEKSIGNQNQMLRDGAEARPCCCSHLTSVGT